MIWKQYAPKSKMVQFNVVAIVYAPIKRGRVPTVLLACLVVIQVAPPSRNSLGAMAPSSLAQNLQLVVAGLGGTPPGNEAALVTSVRARLNGKYNKGDSLSRCRSAFLSMAWSLWLVTFVRGSVRLACER